MHSMKTHFYTLLTALALPLLASGAHAQRLSIQEVPLTPAHVLYDSINQKIYVSIPGTAALNPNTVARINAGTGAVEAYIPVGSEPDVLALSSDGSYLYVGIDDASSVERINLASNTVDQQFFLPTSPKSPLYHYHAGSIVPLPGLPQSVAVALDYFGSYPANDGIAIYDNGIQRPNHLSGGMFNYEPLVGSNSATRLYAYNSIATLSQINLDSSGISPGSATNTMLGSPFNGTFSVKFDRGNGLIYTSYGSVIDPAAITSVGTFPSSSLNSEFSTGFDVVPSDAENKVYFLAGSAYSYQAPPVTLSVYNQTTFQQTASYATTSSYTSVGDLSEISPTRFVFRSNAGVEIATPQTATSVTITPATPTVAEGKMDQFTATAHYPDGSTADVTSLAIWSSGSAAVATISGTGLAEGISSGTANITATVNGLASTPYVLTVAPAHYQVLWNNANGAASIWDYNAEQGTFTQHTYGPYPNWTAKTITQGGTNGLTRVLWDNTDGAASLWELNNAAGTFTQTTYGPYLGWTAAAVAVASYGDANNLLWNNSDGRSSLWYQNPDDFGSFTQSTYAPNPGWTAQAILNVPYGQTLVLEDNADGRMSLDNAGDTLSQLDQSAFGPYAGWTATAVSVGTDNTIHILWDNIDSRLSLWNYSDSSRTFTQNTYGPYPGWTAKAIADGSDGKTLVLWDNVNGAASIWSLDNTTGLFNQHTFGPYPGWTAAAVSGSN
jgi:hypothetical protein